MNTALKISAASALVLAGVGAHASIASPSGSSSDAILFAEVVNSAGTAPVASYAGDTGVSINTLLAGYTGTVLTTDSNLTKLFAADAAGDTIYWGLQGSQAGTTFVSTTGSSSTLKLKTLSNSTLGAMSDGFTSDIATLNSNAGGASSIEGTNPATSGVWDITASINTSNWYNNLLAYNTTTATGGTAETLFSEMISGGDANQAAKGTYASIGTASLSAAGLSITGAAPPPPSVPLPAAVWLLGSGLLGLTGVARRKLKA